MVWEADQAVQQQSAIISKLIRRSREREESINVLEVGCANSFWLPHIARKFGVNIYGIDYSMIGCLQAKSQLVRQNVSGNIFCQDFLQFAELQRPLFDLVISFGFIEHFTDPSAALQSMYQVLKPGGLVFATVPNITGIYKPLVRIMNKDVYDDHVLMNDVEIREQTIKSGFVDVQSGYTGGTIYFSVLNFQTAKSSLGHVIMSFLSRVVRLFDIIVGFSLSWLKLNRNNRFTSPYIYVIGLKSR